MTTKPRIIITADETMMSRYRGGMFLGFSTCSPRGILPDWLFFLAFAPPVPRKNGRALFADFGLRMVEASLLRDGFTPEEVAVVHPRDLKRMVGDNTEIVAFGGHDYLGINPPTSTFVDLARTGPPYNRVKFLELLRNPALKKLTSIVGGKASWQLADEQMMDRLGIDHLFMGEGEITMPQVCRQILNGEEVPRIIEGEEVPVDEIPNLTAPTTHGLVEIARGCGRGCEFCTPGMLKVRYKPVEHIIRDVELNIKGGNDSALLHSEDVMRYGARGIPADPEKVMNLVNSVSKIPGVDTIGFSHLALATVYHHPKLLEDISEVLLSMPGQVFNGAQTGVETGSSHLMHRYMRGKCLPASPENWRELVIQSLSLLHDNRWICACTLIVGLPEETEQDVIDTIELMDDVISQKLRMFMVPMNFVSMGPSKLSAADSHTVEKMTPAHWTLFGKCMEHDVKIAREMKDMMLEGNIVLKGLANFAMTRFINGTEFYSKIMQGGKPPKDYSATPSYYLVPAV